MKPGVPANATLGYSSLFFKEAGALADFFHNICFASQRRSPADVGCVQTQGTPELLEVEQKASMPDLPLVEHLCEAFGISSRSASRSRLLANATQDFVVRDSIGNYW